MKQSDWKICDQCENIFTVNPRVPLSKREWKIVREIRDACKYWGLPTHLRWIHRLFAQAMIWGIDHGIPVSAYDVGPNVIEEIVEHGN